MKEILFNLALINAMNFCKEHKINCSGSHLVKQGRGFTYNLVRNSDGQTIVAVTFYKNQVPMYWVSNK